MIPNYFIQFWHDFSSLPDAYRTARKVSVKLHKGFKLIYADDQYVLELIDSRDELPLSLYELYYRNQIPASRSDMARLVLLYVFGGVYADMSMLFKCNIGEILAVYPDAELLFLQRDDMPKYRSSPEKAHIANGILCASPASGFIRHCLYYQAECLLSGIYNRNVLKATGPGILNDMLFLYGEKYCYKKLSFKRLKKDFLEHLRLPELSNSWKKLEREGIYSEEDLNYLRNIKFGLG